MNDTSLDAKFEDGDESPLQLVALDQEDLKILSALAQDAVFPASEMAWDSGRRRFSMLLNRFRWEDAQAGSPASRPVERVQSVLSVTDVLKVQSQGIAQTDKEAILSLLSVSFTEKEDGMGRVEFTLAGDGAIALEVETLNITVQDVTRPYVAPSKMTPEHPE
jgi:hypothetical protein